MKSKKARVYKSKILEELMNEMENDPWYVKFNRWLRLKEWLLFCKLKHLKKNY